MAWPSPYPPLHSSSPYPPYSPASTSQPASPYSSIPSIPPEQRTVPSLSRSTTYLASLGPSLARPPPPPSAPPVQGHFSDGPATYNQAGMGDRRHSTPGTGGRGWNGDSASSSLFSSTKGGARSSYGSGSKPPVTGRPEIPHKSASSPTPSLPSGGTDGNGKGGRRLQKPRRNSPSPGYPSSLPPTSPAYPPSPAFPPSSYPHPPAPSHSPYPPYNPSSAPATAQSSPSLQAMSYMAPLAPVQSAPTLTAGGAYAGGGGLQRTATSPYPPVPPPGAGEGGYAISIGAEYGNAEEEKMRVTRQEEEELARIHSESLFSEQTRLSALAVRESALLNRTLEASTHSQLRSEALEMERERAEEAAMRAAVEESRREEEMRRRRDEEEIRRAVEASRVAKGKGKGGVVEREDSQNETEEDKREREAVEMAKRLSLNEAARRDGAGGRVETSAQAFDRLSRPSASAPLSGVTSYAHDEQRSPSPHPLFQHPASSPPTAPTSTALPPEPSSSSAVQHTGYSSPAAPGGELPPPAYEYPAHASEFDEPDDVIVGPGRPLPPPPSAVLPASTAPPPPPGAAPASFHHASEQPYPVYSRSSPSGAQPVHAQPHHHPVFASSSAFTRDTYPPPRSEVGSTVAPSTISAQAGSFVSTAYQTYKGISYGDERDDEEEGEQGQEDVGRATLAASPEEHASGGRDPFSDEFSIVDVEQEDHPVQQQASPPLASSPPKDLFASAMAARRASATLSPTSAASIGAPCPPPSSSASPSSPSHPPAPTRRPPGLPLEALATPAPRLSVVVENAGRSSSRGSSSPPTSTPDGASRSAETPAADPRSPSPDASGVPDSTLLSAPPTASTSSTLAIGPSSSSSASPSTASFHSTPSHGGLVSVPSTAAPPFARQDVLDGVKWGFVDKERAAMHPPLEFEGDFPRAAQLSGTKSEPDEGDIGKGKELFRCFAVEAKGWQSLLVYLMWHGNSRIEAAPSDLQADKSNRGLQASLSLDFFRSFSTHQPRVRITLTLLPLAHAAPLTPIANSPYSALPVDPPLLEDECPSIRLALPAPLTLPLPLSAIATTLSHAHTASRQTLRVLEQGVVGGASFGVGGGTGHSSATARILADRATLAKAIDLFRRLNGERVFPEGRGAGGGDDAEVSTLDRLKARLRRTKKARLIRGEHGNRAGASGMAAGGPLPEGAMLITPFAID